MQDHIRDLVSHFQHCEQLRETAVSQILFGGEEVSQVMEDLGIHNGYTIRSWVQLYHQKMKTGLLTLPALKQAQKRWYNKSIQGKKSAISRSAGIVLN